MMSYHRQIEEMAYELYQKNGGVDGNDLDHWFEAERIVSSRQVEKEVNIKAARQKAPATKKSVLARAGKATRKMPDAGLL